MSKKDLETLIRENPAYGGVAQKGSASAIFKAEMIWPSERVVTIKPIDVYLRNELENHTQPIAILDMPFDRVVVSIRRNIKDNVYPVSPSLDGDVMMVIIYEGIRAEELTGSVGFRHNAGRLEVYEIEATFKLAFDEIKKRKEMKELWELPAPSGKLTFKLSKGNFMF